MVAPIAALVTAAWVALLVATPLLPAAVAALIYGIGSFICHQLPERSFHLGEFQLPVCARCLGIYAGLAIGTVSRVVPRSNRGATRHWGLTASSAGAAAFALRAPASLAEALRSREAPALRQALARWVIGVAALPTVITVALESIGAWRVSNAGRAAAGSTLGIGVALVVMSALATLHYSSCVPRRPTAPSRPPPRI